MKTKIKRPAKDYKIFKRVLELRDLIEENEKLYLENAIDHNVEHYEELFNLDDQLSAPTISIKSKNNIKESIKNYKNHQTLGLILDTILTTQTGKSLPSLTPTGKKIKTIKDIPEWLK